jgi:ribosomal protein L37E
MLKLTLHQNALHTLHHAIEHLASAIMVDRTALEDRVFDHESQTVEWRTNGLLTFNTTEFTSPPSSYNLKFSLLHLIQAAELLLKAHIFDVDKAALFVKPGSKRTIGLQEALQYVVERYTEILEPGDISLLLQAKELRNRVEHFEFNFIEQNLRALCIDYLAICSLLAEKLLKINLVEVFSWDYLRDRPDPVGQQLKLVLNETTATGRLAMRKAGATWAERNPSRAAYLCLSCGARTVAVDIGTCMACGTEGDQQISKLIDELEAATLAFLEKKKFTQ